MLPLPASPHNPAPLKAKASGSGPGWPQSRWGPGHSPQRGLQDPAVHRADCWAPREWQASPFPRHRPTWRELPKVRANGRMLAGGGQTPALSHLSVSPCPLAPSILLLLLTISCCQVLGSALPTSHHFSPQNPRDRFRLQLHLIDEPLRPFEIRNMAAQEQSGGWSPALPPHTHPRTHILTS